MKNRKWNVLLAALVVLILGVGLMYTISPRLNLKNTILKLVELPKTVFDYVRENPKEDDGIVESDVNQASGGDNVSGESNTVGTGDDNPEPSDNSGNDSHNPDSNRIETPLITFDEEDETEQSGNSEIIYGDNRENYLPIDMLENIP